MQRSSPGRDKGMSLKDQEWANELRRADERAVEIRTQKDELIRTLAEAEAKIKQLSDAIEVRDNEIVRLSQLYQGGQNIEKLNMQYQQDVNEEAMTKLQNQVDFLLKENHRI